MLWSLGRFDDAEAQISRGMALWPRHYAVWFARVYYLMFNGRAAEAALLIRDEATRPLGIPDWNYSEIEQQAKAIASGNARLVDDAVKLSAELAKRGTGFAENAAVFASFVGHLDTAYRMVTPNDSLE